MSRLLLPIICCALFCIPPSCAAATPENQRALFQRAYADLQGGKTDSFTTLPTDLKTYPLYPWLEYAYLNRFFDNAPDTQILDFALRNPNSLMADSLYIQLAKRLAAKQDWRQLLASIPADLDDTDTQCYRVQALAASGRQQEALASGKQTWMTIDKALSNACQPVTTLLRNHSLLSTEDYWERIRAAIDKNQTTLATQLAADLPPEISATVAVWIQIRRDPASALPTAFQQADTPYLRETLAFGLERLARKQPESAESLWLQARQKFKFTPEESGRVESALGMYQALRHDSAALARLAAIPAEHRTQDGNLWLARMAARYGDWEKLLDATRQLKFDDPRDAAGWHYWQARALEQTGKQREAASLYASIAPQASFYGFLAADRLGQGYSSLQAAPVDRSQRVAGLQKLAAIQRAFEWFALGERAQGRKEWFRILKQADKEGMLAAADLATRAGDPNLAIWTISRAKEWDETYLRFPLIHTDLVQEQARNNGLQPAWILGVMRRESAFDPNAESPANALGLMQLIPPTARHVARKLGLNINGKDDILQPATNIQLGSAYLRDMLGKFSGNYALATAAYNAGPARPPQWAPESLINADQWVESIPFTETRDYVQAVMTYTTIYDYKLNAGKGRRLSERLPPVPPATPPAATAQAATLPTAKPD
ncbi:transglycosylase SLT domain-containing protein [Candidatus Thiothrix sp. Deng01]|uniref:Transglycosylase SLT domain-containing protein n=1 Tax=Candidatus Thiothrix phosphatis TaxID=3112415 RepID=A0ABU6CUF3_9GAMM|nr:transglycosylase SLT domain-containing protein [Candidatus Thiothrix sp. Deng01]MEB4590454.1 transglycosylase SLT domain-containing protein [Candidatus Thiothrix sp. Deng01]